MAKIILDEKIQQAVLKWRGTDKDIWEDRYKGASETTKRLLYFWFEEEHFLKDGVQFKYYPAQREAIESLIYVYEICKYHSLSDLYRNFEVEQAISLAADKWTKYCFKMATGSGKTFIMALAIVWQYFNKFFQTDNDVRYGLHYLMIAPNLIVWDRLADSFEDNKIFKQFPFVPEEWKADLDIQLIKQSDIVPINSKAVLFLTNVQQLYDRKKSKDTINPITQEIGSEPEDEEEIVRNNLLNAILSHDDLIVVNDEAHHAHTDDIQWVKKIGDLNENLKEKYSKPLIMQLDFSATPRYLTAQNRFFEHIIYDYPLAQAIKDKIVKKPIIGEIEGAPDKIGKDFIKNNCLQIDTGVEIWREYQTDFKAIKKKAVLFIMADNNKNADLVYEYLVAKKGFDKDEVLLIHTKGTSGDITAKDLPELRNKAKLIDDPKNPYKIIVSVMMLKEGWDVKNVVSIVPLRAYGSQILVEQTLGRGLRRIEPPDSGWDEKLTVIEHPRFRELWKAEIKDQELNIEIKKANRVYEAPNKVEVDKKKSKYDIDIPVVEGGVTRDISKVTELKVNKLPKNPFKYEKIKLPKIMYKEEELLTKKLIRKKELAFDYTDNYSIYLSFITKAILTKIGGSSKFEEIVPKVKEYIEKYLFDKKVNIKNKEVVKKLNYPLIRERLLTIFTDSLNELTRYEEEYNLLKYFKVSSTETFHTNHKVYPANKTVFNQTSVDNKYEKAFVMYLDEQDEVKAFTKIMRSFPTRIPYYNQFGFLKHYFPDFVIKTNKGFVLLETKGEGYDEMESAKLKAKAGTEWCNKVSQLTKNKWTYVKVVDKIFSKYETLKFSKIVELLKQG